MSVAAELATARPPRASLGRRGSAFALDLALLLAGLVGAFMFGVQIGEDLVVIVLACVWLFLVAPLYFALYHGRSTGRTPGERETGIALRHVQAGGRIGTPRALVRAYGGLLASLLLVPLLVDLGALLVDPERRPLHDRLFGTTVERAPRSEQTIAQLPPTAAPALELFEPTTRKGYVVTARAVVAAHRREIGGATTAAYALLVLLAAVLAPLIAADFGSEDQATDALVEWTLYAIALFASGIFWTEAAIVVAFEAVRTGDRPLRVGELLRRACRRANGLTITLLLLAPLVTLTAWTLIGGVLLARFALVVPAILLEDRSVLAAFGRSWTLTRGSTGPAFGLLLGSMLAVAATAGVACGIAFAVVAAFAGSAGPLVFALAVALALLVASIPVSGVLAIFGSAWCLFYYDLRRAQGQGR